MKKFKYFALLLLSALCIFAAFTFGGCKKQAGYFIEDSLTYTFDNSYIYSYSVEGNFKINVPEAGKYTVNYILTAYGEDGTQSKTKSTSLVATKSGEQTVRFYVSFDKQNRYKNNSTARISDVTITKTEVEDDYYSYAIGFGVAGGVVLIGLTVVFILDKTGVLYKRK